MVNREVSIILHNVRSAYNVGSIFRTADAIGARKMYLCGYTPIPTAPGGAMGQVPSKIAKTALGAEKSIPWEHFKQTLRLIKKLKSEGIRIVALEQTRQSVDYRNYKPKFPLVILAGHERNGLSPKILQYVDEIIQIPMYGRKESLNVSVATGIALFKIIEYKKIIREKRKNRA